MTDQNFLPIKYFLSFVYGKFYVALNFTKSLLQHLATVYWIKKNVITIQFDKSIHPYFSNRTHLHESFYTVSKYKNLNSIVEFTLKINKNTKRMKWKRRYIEKRPTASQFKRTAAVHRYQNASLTPLYCNTWTASAK